MSFHYQYNLLAPSVCQSYNKNINKVFVISIKFLIYDHQNFVLQITLTVFPSMIFLGLATYGRQKVFVIITNEEIKLIKNKSQTNLHFDILNAK